MSLVADSPLNSSSSDDFAAFLDAELGGKSAESSPDEEAEVDFFKDEEAGDEEAEDEEARDEEAEDEEAGDDNDLNNKRIKRCKVEVLESIHEQGSTSYATLEQQTEATANVDICTHPGSFGEMCILCGQRLDEESGVTFGYIHKGLRLGNDEIVRLRNTDMKYLLRHRKLYLVLDLDHTLLNSTLLAHLTPEEDYLKSQADSLQDVSKGSLFMLTFMHMMTKLRPFVRTFLKEASQMFEMYIYTMGDRPYALEMAKLLDPTREYFSARVISRDDGTQRHQKGLDVVLGQESAVLILDDTENAWAKHKDNLILMERYHFFASSCHQFGYNCKSLSELKSDESDPDGALASVLKVLKRVHNMFFDELRGDVTGKDVRQVLKTVRKQVLKDCKIVFSRVFPTKFPAENHHLWKMAEQLGATCLTEHDSSVTHVVSTDAGTEKSRWALKENKFLVHPRWIEAANFLWQKQPEESFPVKLPNKPEEKPKQPEENFPVEPPKQPEEKPKQPKESLPVKPPKD
ncbi:RNA polymerase II C-terminal domain phosphatase-like 4 isoform X1 [Pistacia vera]|uniref:RNA polymerase II C-terminal domain phosphatase-like 4 isoform X1 n=2 Tax=Pistacia vera TaxID=55513 RepID=UPI001262FD1F|nr:RNA polymerase II C-terminal domain phosphatase-like 4 isoform X1 [Pistacia vera]XP_031266332.1 RNA polymerase II C-terminal domain phosphatase-like 4 isoform X1 [Pistacia vera]